jgi:hypothetical protein
MCIVFHAKFWSLFVCVLTKCIDPVDRTLRSRGTTKLDAPSDKTNHLVGHPSLNCFTALLTLLLTILKMNLPLTIWQTQ